MKTLGEKIKHLREKNELTQKAFAHKCSVSPRQLSLYEKNTVPVSDRAKKQIEIAFEINLDEYLVDLEVEKYIQIFKTFNSMNRQTIIGLAKNLKSLDSQG